MMIFPVKDDRIQQYTQKISELKELVNGKEVEIRALQEQLAISKHMSNNSMSR